MKNRRQKTNQSFGVMLRKIFFAGLAVIFPLFITFYIILAIFQFSEGIIGRYINSELMQEYGFKIPGLGLILMLMIIFGAGIISRNFLGQKMLPLFEKLFFKLPVVANIYPSAKRLSGFLFGEEERKKFKKVVLIEYPQRGSYSIGFITNEEMPNFGLPNKEKLASVFIPLAPAPFSGIILLVPEEKITVINVSIDTAIKFIVSGGVISLPEPEKATDTDIAE